MIATLGKKYAQEEAKIRPDMEQKLRPRGSRNEAHNWAEIALRRKQKL